MTEYFIDSNSKNKYRKMKNSENSKDSIELKELIIYIKNNRKILYKSLIIFFILAIFIIIFTPKQYKTQISLLAESNTKGSASGLLGNLGSLSGLDMGNLMGFDISASGSDVLKPELYPDVVNSTTFLIDILKTKITEPKSKNEITVSEYITEHTKPTISGYIGYIIDLIKGNSKQDLFSNTDLRPLRLNKAESDVIKSLSGLINIAIVKSGGGITGGDSKIIKVSVEAQNPEVSAVLSEMVVNSLKQYIIDYNTNKVKKDLKFIEARYTEAQKNYYKAQEALAKYEDRNTDVVLESIKTYKKRLETEHDLTSDIYNSLAQKLEQAKILVQDKTPAFTVIEPAKVPIKKSKPKRLLILVSMFFIGCFIGLSYIFLKDITILIWKTMFRQI